MTVPPRQPITATAGAGGVGQGDADASRPSFDAPASRTGRLPVALLFGLFGVVAGTWAGRIPWVQDARQLSPGELGLALLAPALGAVVAMPFAGRLTSRHGSRPAATFAIVAAGVTLMLPAAAPTLPLIWAGLFLFGAATATLDVAVNAAAVEVERRAGRPLMSGLHGLWSAGGLAGAALAGVVAAAGVGAPVHLAAVGAATAVAGAVLARRMVPGPAGSAAAPVFALPSRGVVLLGLIGFCAFFVEGVVADWSGVFLAGSRGTSEAVAASGFAVFSVCMVLGRLSGDAVVARFGPVPTVAAAAAVSAAGLTFALAVPSVPAAWIGFGLTGLGMATVVPLAFSAAGHRAGGDQHRAATEIAAVATMSYVGWLAGPPLIGGVASVTSLPVALGVAAALSAAIALLSRALRR